jgi:Rrf2 family protein
MNVLIKRDQDYAIRICAYLAGRPDREPVSLSRTSKLLYISRPFASKIVFQLRKSGIIGTVQGKNGGLYLLKSPDELSIYTILEAMNFNSTLNECIRNHNICPRIGECSIHLYFREQEAVLIKSFKDKKIAEFAIYNKDLIQQSKGG